MAWWIAATVAVILGGESLVASEPKGSGVRDVLLARQEALQNVVASFWQEEEFFPPEKYRKNPVIKIPGQTGHLQVRVAPRTTECSFRFCYGKAQYEWRLVRNAKEGNGSVDRAYELRSYDGSREEGLWQYDAEGGHHGSISRTPSLPHDSVIEVALGLRPYDVGQWLDSERLQGFAMTSPKEGTVILEQGRHVWRFQAELGYALVDYQVVANDRPTLAVRNSDFAVVGQLRLPRSIVVEEYRSNQGKPEVSRKWTLRVHQYQLNDPENRDRSFRITWPLGSQVIDEQTGAPMVVTSGPRTIDDETLVAVDPAGPGPDGSPEPSRWRPVFVGLNVLIVLLLLAWATNWRRLRRRKAR